MFSCIFQIQVSQEKETEKERRKERKTGKGNVKQSINDYIQETFYPAFIMYKPYNSPSLF